MLPEWSQPARRAARVRACRRWRWRRRGGRGRRRCEARVGRVGDEIEAGQRGSETCFRASACQRKAAPGRHVQLAVGETLGQVGKRRESRCRRAAERQAEAENVLGQPADHSPSPSGRGLGCGRRPVKDPHPTLSRRERARWLGQSGEQRGLADGFHQSPHAGGRRVRGVEEGVCQGDRDRRRLVAGCARTVVRRRRRRFRSFRP